MNSINHARALGVDGPTEAKKGRPMCPAHLRKAAATVAASALLGLISGCAHMNAGIRVYEPATESRADGSQRAVSRLVASISGDMPGLRDLTVGRVAMTFDTAVQGAEEEPVLNKEGQLVAVRRTPILAGFFSGRAIAAQGKANRETIDGVAAGITGAVLSAGGAAVAGGIPGAVSGGLAP